MAEDNHIVAYLTVEVHREDEEKTNTKAYRLYERLGNKVFRDDGNRYMMINDYLFYSFIDDDKSWFVGGFPLCIWVYVEDVLSF